jgi:hypothetical protein
MNSPTLNELEAGLEDIRSAPKDNGVLKLIVRRPRSGEREVLESGELSRSDGLVGDSWRARGPLIAADGTVDTSCQLNIMSSRVIALLAQTKERWALAGDQLFVDLDLSAANLPPGTKLSIGAAVIEVTEEPHTGCGKFSARFGNDAVRFVNGHERRALQLRGINARVLQGGSIRVGDRVTKIT